MEAGRGDGAGHFGHKGRSHTLASKHAPKVSISNLMEILKAKTTNILLKSYPGMRKKPNWGSISGVRDIV